jgi:hypothetical protein
MKGKIYKGKHNEWLVKHEDTDYQLHPDDVEDLLDLERRFDFIEGRIAASPEVEFTIVEHQKLTGTATYAKLIQL